MTSKPKTKNFKALSSPRTNKNTAIMHTSAIEIVHCGKIEEVFKGLFVRNR